MVRETRVQFQVESSKNDTASFNTQHYKERIMSKVE